MNFLKRMVADHLGHILGSPEEGYLDLWTTMMHLPAKWQEDLKALFIRAHELVHLRLTYSTGLGIFLDTISGLSSVKLFNLLKETSKGDVLFPLAKNIYKSTAVSQKVLGSVAFCMVCELGIKTALETWRYLQEAAATYVMLELAPSKIIQETKFSESEVRKVKSEILKYISNFSNKIYVQGYEECLRVKGILGANHVYPSILIASDIPLYTIDLFYPPTGQKIWKFRGDKFALEIERFCNAIQTEYMNPLQRFRKIIRLIKERRVSPLNEQTLGIFNQFIVPDLFPDEEWQNKIDKWVANLIETFGDFSPDLAPKALHGYRQLVELGWTPFTAFHDGEGTQIQIMKWGQEFGLLRYLLGNLKVACYDFPNEPITIYFPQNWEELNIANYLYEFENIVSKHDLPIFIKKVRNLSEK